MMWETHSELRGHVQTKWSVGPPCTSVEDLRRKLQELAKGLGRWSRDAFGSVRKEIKALKQKLANLREDPLRLGPSHEEFKDK